jgi:adenylosuccinate synthase
MIVDRADASLLEQAVMRPRQSRSVIVMGAQWGDEGKGSEIDLLTEYVDAVVRYNGGANAGHTIVVDGKQTILHVLPSGIMNPKAKIILTDGVAVQPKDILSERASLPDDVSLEDRLFIASNANIVTPMHIHEDIRHEKAGKGVGSTRNGMRPCYEDRAGRRAVTFGDVLRNPEVAKSRIQMQMDHWNYTEKTAEEVYETLRKDVNKLAECITDTGRLIDEERRAGKNIMYEAGQGTLLDVYHGTYRNVTSSHTISGGACTSAGAGPTTIDEVVGVAKLVMTRVGDGPFPSELVGEQRQKDEFMEFVLRSEKISMEDFEALEPPKQNATRKRWAKEFKLPEDYQYVVDHMKDVESLLAGKFIAKNIGDKLNTILGTEDREGEYNHILGMYFMKEAGEFGATTGRPRRTGWFDAAALRYAKRINGFTAVALTKLDCLGDLPIVKMVVGYELGKERFDELPMEHIEDQNLKPIYETFAGWSKSEVENARSFADLPENAKIYLTRVAEIAEVGICSIGVGPDREQTIELYNPITDRRLE